MNIYLAGPMPNDPTVGEQTLARWRDTLMKSWDRIWKWAIPGIVFLCPEFVGKSHDNYEATVVEDFALLDKAQVCFVFLDGPNREGTLIEMGRASARMPVVGVVMDAYYDHWEPVGGGTFATATFSEELLIPRELD